MPLTTTSFSSHQYSNITDRARRSSPAHQNSPAPKLPSSQLSTSDLSWQTEVSSVAQPPRKPCGTDKRISYSTSEVKPSPAWSCT
eukprot:94407-Prorocentrum_lima.AAC.1